MKSNYSIFDDEHLPAVDLGAESESEKWTFDVGLKRVRRAELVGYTPLKTTDQIFCLLFSGAASVLRREPNSISIECLMNTWVQMRRLVESPCELL